MHIILQSLPAWGVRVEIGLIMHDAHELVSLPAWGVRVEIALSCPVSVRDSVTPRMGSAG